MRPQKPEGHEKALVWKEVRQYSTVQHFGSKINHSTETAASVVIEPHLEGRHRNSLINKILFPDLISQRVLGVDTP